MQDFRSWKFLTGQKRHTQDGPQIVALVRPIGRGLRRARTIDVGCGDGIIAFDLLQGRKATHVVAIDIFSEAIEVTGENLKSYIADGKAEVEKISAAKFFRSKKNWDRFDQFVINPPFFAHGSGQANKNSWDQIARHDSKLSLKLWARGARKLLRTGGQLYCVFPTERLAETLAELSSQEVEPKEIWWLKDDRRKRRFFLRAVRGAKPGMIVHFDYQNV